MSIEFSQDELGDFIVDGKRYCFSELTPEQRERFAKQDWAFKLGYNGVSLGIPVSVRDLNALKDPDLLNYFHHGKSTAMEDIKFINANLN